MDDYAELIKKLRAGTGLPVLRNLMFEAADAIEELSAFYDQVTDGHFYIYRDGALHRYSVEPPKGKSITFNLTKESAGA